jgi:hypothetical protein
MPEMTVRTLIGAGCAYEVFALTTRRTPTLSKMCRNHRWFEAALLIVLVAHFHWKENGPKTGP